MKGFVLGLLVASAGWVGGFYVYNARQAGLRAEAPEPATVEPAAASKPGRKGRRRASATAKDSFNAAELGANEAPERKLTAAELRPASRGDDLSRPDVLSLDMGDNNAAPELSEEEIDQRFRDRQDAILDCIDKARPDEQTYVPGRVTVQFRIQRTGQVRGVRVEAPSVLQQGGLYSCVKSVVMGLRFPPSSGSQVVTFPFALS